ncbi:MAG TPA: NADH-quinone oxidoreductase subunit NuoN [Methyloceanibacter sp.]|nr:NADH-quinone oxidoreductase subunit NuoN [Methyloceanibacter sp.]
MQDTLDLATALPELILAIGAMALLMLGVFTRREQGGMILLLAVGVLAAAGIAVAAGSGTQMIFHDSFIVDPFARLMKLLTLIGAGAALLMSADYWRRSGGLKFEYPVLILLATTGMMMMISANDLIALYVGLELQSLALYVIAAFRRDSVLSSEAGVKYFVLGALSSGMLLYGASLIYGFTGATDFANIAAAVQPSEQNLGLIFGLVFLMAGFAFKISAVPFHMWTPDVYQGAPTPVTAFFAAAPKLAAMALTVRVLVTAFPSATEEWQQIVTFLAIASMALGSFAAIGQRNIKRLMAYSSIGHMGYALIGLAAGSEEGVQGLIVYLTIYLAMTLGTFACILAMRRGGRMVEEIEELSGLSRTQPLLAFMLAMLLFSLAGIPPLAGFFAKFYVFLAAIQAGLYALAVIGVLLSVVGAYYYLRIVKLMYFDAPAARFEPMPASLAGVLGVSGIFTLLYFVYPAPLVAVAGAAAKSLF